MLPMSEVNRPPMGRTASLLMAGLGERITPRLLCSICSHALNVKSELQKHPAWLMANAELLARVNLLEMGPQRIGKCVLVKGVMKRKHTERGDVVFEMYAEWLDCTDVIVTR